MTRQSELAHRAPRRRPPMHIVAPATVALAVGALLLESGAEALRPAMPIAVRPVVFDRSQPEPEAQGTQRRGVAVQAAGWLEADPFYIAATALADGVVREMLVLEGERVEQGQVIARLVDDDARLALARAEAELETRQAELQAAEADLAAADVDWANPVERERAVAVARAALEETEAELAQVPAMIAAEQARLERDQEELERARKALARDAATELEVIIYEKTVESQAAAVDIMRKREAILRAKRDRLTAELAAAERNADLRVMERRALDASKAAVTSARAAVRQAEAARDEAQLRLDRMTIRAPITGYVQSRFKVPGDKVMLAMDDPHSAHLVHLYDPQKIQVRVDVPLADASHVFTGQQCEVVVEVLPDATFVGEVTRITHEADLQKNTLQVKVRVIDPSPLLRPEMLTRVKFLPDGAAAGSDAVGDASPVRVPEASLDRAAGGARVWVVRDRRAGAGVVRPVAVTLVTAEAGWATVRGDLRPGDLLALEPAGLTEGQRVRMRDPDREASS
ncbi:MAG: efflux RND transporter periplasmic adaptor subunit [Phycisphaerales bacterium JB039]